MSGAPADEDLASAPQPGTIFADKYRIERLLGAGGMGYVLAAMHLQLQERVAIKMLLPKLATRPDTVERFLREGRAAVKIKSEHVGRVLDVGSVDGTSYIVMEFLDGSNLDELLAREGRLEPRVAVDYVMQACEAIAEAHALRIVHRDLKPANLFLVHKPDGTPVVKVLDFGISKMSGPEGAEQLSMTKTATLLGSPLYMSPEQLRSARVVDERSDVWSLGVILFELMAGVQPFVADTIAELGALVLAGRAPDVRERAPAVPEGLAYAISRCLRTHPDDRYPSLAELARDVSAFGSPSAMESAARIARVLESVPRPAGSSPTSGRAAALAFQETHPSGGSWGGATLPGPQSSGAVVPPRSRARMAAVAGALALFVGGILGARWLLAAPTSTTVLAAPASAISPPAQPSASSAVPPAPMDSAVASSTAAAAEPPSASAAPWSRPTVRGQPATPRPSAVASVQPPPSSSPAPARTTPPAPSTSPSGFAASRYE
jgi:serine/threonine-protein kinase